MRRFELLDISADAGIMAFGRNIGELFQNAAAGMYSLITDIDSIQAKKALDVFIEKDSLERLLVAWLNELIFRFDVEGFVAGRILITLLAIPAEETHEGGDGKTFAVRASLSGEEFDPVRHERRLLLKAATYHGLQIEKKGDVWQSKIVFDV